MYIWYIYIYTYIHIHIYTHKHCHRQGCEPRAVHIHTCVYVSLEVCMGRSSHGSGQGGPWPRCLAGVWPFPAQSRGAGVGPGPARSRLLLALRGSSQPASSASAPVVFARRFAKENKINQAHMALAHPQHFQPTGPDKAMVFSPLQQDHRPCLLVLTP